MADEYWKVANANWPVPASGKTADGKDTYGHEAVARAILLDIRGLLKSIDGSLAAIRRNTKPQPKPAPERKRVDPESLTPEQREAMARLVTSLDLGVRARRVIVGMGVKTVGDLTALSESDLLEQIDFGMQCLRRVTAELAAIGLTLNGP